MKINPDFVSPCGLYCGVCAIHIAHRDNYWGLYDMHGNVWEWCQIRHLYKSDEAYQVVRGGAWNALSGVAGCRTAAGSYLAAGTGDTDSGLSCSKVRNKASRLARRKEAFVPERNEVK